MIALVGPLVTLAQPALNLVPLATFAPTIAFLFDVLVVGGMQSEPLPHWRHLMARLSSLGGTGAVAAIGAGLSGLFVLAMAEATHGLPRAAEAAVRYELGLCAMSVWVWRAFALLGGAGRRSISEGALRSQAMRSNTALMMILDEKDGELTRLRVELAAARKSLVTHEDSLRRLRSQSSTQSADLVSLMAQTLELRDQLSEADLGEDKLARKKGL
ncbi:hypothetical protein T492DRAFT_977737 [Pavlovales sp. CCMP2436]|nr:hypothetical protein T492DRAFT_977737 [Pavlovales sp. CCMP2436]